MRLYTAAPKIAAERVELLAPPGPATASHRMHVRGVVSSPKSVDEGPRSSGGDSGSGWRTSSFSDQNECVEVSISDDVVRVRNSRDRTRPFLAFEAADWSSFTAGIRRGEFAARPDRSS